MKETVKPIVNFAICAMLIWIFQLIGWISIQADIAPFETVVANQLLVSTIVGLFFTIFLWLARALLAIFIMTTCGIGCFLIPIYYIVLGPAGFWFVAQFLPDWVEVNTGFWKIVAMGVMISIIRLHPSIEIETSDKETTS